ncbi:MAG: 4Fe-4S dicluster domain-containing protein [Candidatus Aminicenantes bacterium]|nr:4Fe-4S dicluster domain-containing protein [Candidatus Aminicenantes bacterium]
MAKRKIIEIDRDLCNGCGLCTTACMEGALALDGENKAVLVRELYCDGMGACLDVCPTGALKIIEREGEAYDPNKTYQHVLKTRGKEAAVHVHGADEKHSKMAPPRMPETLACGCPGSMAREIDRKPEPAPKPGTMVSGRSELTQWPVQLHLVSPFAPYFRNADLLIAADCTAFALGSFHADLLKGKKLVIACPKLDDTAAYTEKIAEIIKQNDLNSLTTAIMTVPCCSGLIRIVENAVASAGSDLEVRKVVVGIDGTLLKPEPRL